MKPQELIELGIPKEAHAEAYAVIKERREAGWLVSLIDVLLKDVAKDPAAAVKNYGDDAAGTLAQKLLDLQNDAHVYRQRSQVAPRHIWGDEASIEAEAIKQLDDACRLPATVRAALMPDAHLGYGLPIGGVLGTRNVVVPWAVGVDIACRMCLTVTDLPISLLETDQPKLVKAIERNTRFGPGAHFKKRRRHAVMDDPDWNATAVTREKKDVAWDQLGTSGAGNHFVEFGIFTDTAKAEYNRTAGAFQVADSYLALMSHSGSRGVGMAVAKHYSKVAEARCRGVPKELRNLSWLSLDSEAGVEYWTAMELMGRYASANHQLIHDSILRTLGGETAQRIENHHNFAWLEEHDGEQLVVHRKGATPAHQGVQGVIPGSMGTPAYLVEGKGAEASLCSASHGAGRKMSRTEAKRRYSADDMARFLFKAGVTVISGGVDECPMAYKDIHRVMSEQADLVDVKGTFQPKLVKMAPDKGGRR